MITCDFGRTAPPNTIPRKDFKSEAVAIGASHAAAAVVGGHSENLLELWGRSPLQITFCMGL